MTVELRVGPDTVAIHAIGADPRLLAEHRRARHRGDDQIDPAHWDGLPDGHTRAITLTDPPRRPPAGTRAARAGADAARPPGMGIPVARRDPRRLRRRRRTDRPDRRCGMTPTSRPRGWWPTGSAGTPNACCCTTSPTKHPTLAARAEAAQLGYLDFLDQVLEEEVGVREGRRFRNALKLSGLPHHKTLDEFDFAFQPDLDPRKVRDLATLGFVRAHSNVALLGPPGVGKTHVAVALAVAACQAGFSIYFTSVDDLVRQLREAEALGRFAKKLQTYLKPAVLVLDEVGYLPLSRAEANMLFQLVARRYERGSIILTSNKAFSEWGAITGDEVLATAILDRLLHHCDVLSINGPSYRLKDRFLTPPEPPMP